MWLKTQACRALSSLCPLPPNRLFNLTKPQASPPVCTRLSELRNWMDLDTGSYLSVLDDVCPMGEETKQEEDMRSRKWERRPEARQRECRGWPQKEVTERQLQRASRAEGKTMSGSKRWNWNIKTWRDCPCGEPYWQLLDGVAGISKRYKENQADENTR